MESQIPSPDALKKSFNVQRLLKRRVSQQIALQIFLLCFLLLIYISCKKTNSDYPKQTYPTITSVKPLSAKPGDTITIIGTNFNLNPLMDTVKFNGISAYVQKALSDTLYVIVPAGNCSGTVSVNGIGSTGPQFTVLPAGVNFTITGIKPLSAKPGDTIIITGTHFNLNPAMDTVKFNSISAKVEKANADTLFVIVPSGNATGTVTVNGISAPGPAFVVLQNKITAVKPYWGNQGDTILIIGTIFNPNSTKDTVTISGVTALVIKASADSLYVIVPLTSSGNVIVNGVTAPPPGFIYGPSIIVTTVAGNNIPNIPSNFQGGYTDGPDSIALFNNPTGIHFDHQGNLLVSEYNNACIREISGGFVSTLVGKSTGTSIIGPQIIAPLYNVDGFDIDAQDNIYVIVGGFPGNITGYVAYHSPVASMSIQKISNGMVSVFGLSGFNTNSDAVGFYNATALTFDSHGNLYVAESGDIQKITPSGQSSIFAGKQAQYKLHWLDSPNRYYYAYDTYNGYKDGQDTAARFGDLVGLAVDAGDNIYAVDAGCACIRKVTPSGLVSYFALGGPGFWNPPGPSAIIPPIPYGGPLGICADASGNIYATEGSYIVKITPAGTVSTIAGSNTPGYSDGPASFAQFNNPNALTLDAQGNLYISDVGNQRIRKITFH
jgi:sugar lactone lactonase YvrE